MRMRRVIGFLVLGWSLPALASLTLSWRNQLQPNTPYASASAAFTGLCASVGATPNPTDGLLYGYFYPADTTASAQCWVGGAWSAAYGATLLAECGPLEILTGNSTATFACHPDCAQTCFDDGDLCNGLEACSAPPPDGGVSVCLPGVPLNCDDGLACNTDSCNPTTGCVHALNDAGICTCTAPTVPPLSLGGEVEGDLGSTSCRALTGTLSAKGKIGAMGTVVYPTCANSCVGSGTISGELQFDLSLCSRPVSLKRVASLGVSRDYVPDCNALTCSAGCGTGYCSTATGDSSADVKVSRGLGVKWNKAWAAGDVVLRCGAEVSVNGTASLNAEKVSNNGDTRGTCIECEKVAATLGAGAGVGADCILKLSFRGASSKLGCKGCAALDIQTTGGMSGQRGACGGQLCSTLKSTIKGSVRAPSMRFQRGYWKVEGKCGASWDSCSELRSCGGACSCANGACSVNEPKISCAVCAERSGVSLCVGDQP